MKWKGMALVVLAVAFLLVLGLTSFVDSQSAVRSQERVLKNQPYRAVRML